MPNSAGSLAFNTRQFDTRWLFRGYAYLLGAFGVFLILWGPVLFHPQLSTSNPWASAEFVRIIGGVVTCVACMAFPFSRVEDPSLRGMACMFFAAAHGILAVVVAFQGKTVGAITTTYWPAELISYFMFLFLYAWRQGDGRMDVQTLQTLFQNPENDETQQLRSQYTEQIRLAAGREERHRLARDLHDSVKQQLFVIQTAAATAQARYSSDETGAKEALDHVRIASREAITEMQAMLDQLQAAPLEPAGLVEALKRQCEALGFRTGSRVHVEIGDLPSHNAYTPGLPDAVFRVAQEALSNIARHARAGNVWLSLRTVGSTFELIVRDDGSGFDTGHAKNGMGLDNMKTRTREFGGTFEVMSVPGGGTTITFRFPVREIRKAEKHGRLLLLYGSALVLAIAVMIYKKSLVQSWLIAPVIFQCAVHLTGYVAQRQAGSLRS